MGHGAFSDRDIQERLHLSNDQKKSIADALSRYRMIRGKFRGELDQKMRRILVEQRGDKLDAEVAKLMLTQSKHEHIHRRQTWSEIATILSDQQRTTYKSLRGSMPESLKAELPRLKQHWEPHLSTGPISVRGAQNANVSFPDITPPTADEFIKRWHDERMKQGLNIPDENKVGEIRVIREKIADYVDPPRFYPMIGPARLHHSHYKGTLLLGGDKIDVVYIDGTHIHPITNDKADASSERTESKVSLIAERPDPRSAAGKKSLLRYTITNRSTSPLTDLKVVVLPGQST